MIELDPTTAAVMNITVLDERVVIEDVLDPVPVGLDAVPARRRDVESVQGDVVRVLAQSKGVFLLRGTILAPCLLADRSVSLAFEIQMDSV